MNDIFGGAPKPEEKDILENLIRRYNDKGFNNFLNKKNSKFKDEYYTDENKIKELLVFLDEKGLHKINNGKKTRKGKDLTEFINMEQMEFYKGDIPLNIKDLESSLTYLGTNQTVRYTKNNSYKILVYDFWKKGIYIGNHKDKEYRLYKKYLIKYIDWLKSLDLKYIPKLDGSY